MSTNCLYKKFKGESTNNNLPYRGYIRVSVNIANDANANERFFRYEYLEGGHAEIIGDGYFTSDSAGQVNIGKEVDFVVYEAGGPGSVWLSPGQYTLLIPKKNLVTIPIRLSDKCLFKAYGEDVKYVTTLKEIEWGNRTGEGTLDLNLLHSSEKISKLVLTSVVSGNLGSVDLSEATDVRIANLNSTVTGNLIDLATEYISTMYILGETITPCTLEAFVQKIRTTGKTTGTIDWVWFSSAVLKGFTIGGEEIRNLDINAAGTINWTATTINIMANGQIIREVTA